MAQQIHEVVPSKRIESLFNMELEEQGCSVCFMKSPREVPNIHVIVVYASLLDEGALGMGD